MEYLCASRCEIVKAFLQFFHNEFSDECSRTCSFSDFSVKLSIRGYDRDISDSFTNFSSPTRLLAQERRGNLSVCFHEHSMYRFVTSRIHPRKIFLLVMAPASTPATIGPDTLRGRERSAVMRHAPFKRDRGIGSCAS